MPESSTVTFCGLHIDQAVMIAGFSRRPAHPYARPALGTDPPHPVSDHDSQHAGVKACQAAAVGHRRIMIVSSSPTRYFSGNAIVKARIGRSLLAAMAATIMFRASRPAPRKRFTGTSSSNTRALHRLVMRPRRSAITAWRENGDRKWEADQDPKLRDLELAKC